MAATRSHDPLVWIDCEMTGLDRERDTIMSIACFITDAGLNLKDSEGFEVVIHHGTTTLDAMGNWCKQTHGQSGLSTACMKSIYNAESAASMLLAYIKKHVPEPRRGLLAGNSVHCDKEFLSKGPYKQVLDHLHYRILDVSSIKEAARRWAPEQTLHMVPGKKGLHQAREDILESIEEARYYQQTFFRQDEETA